MVIFHSYVNVYQRVMGNHKSQWFIDVPIPSCAELRYTSPEPQQRTLGSPNHHMGQPPTQGRQHHVKLAQKGASHGIDPIGSTGFYDLFLGDVMLVGGAITILKNDGIRQWEG